MVYPTWIVGPKLFNIVVYVMDDESEYSLRKYVGGPKLRGVIDSPGVDPEGP